MADKQLYRSKDALIAGVCAGVADYFNLDPLIVRIFVVVLTIVSSGLVALAYVVLWIVLPQAPDSQHPYDVEPQASHSETYGTIDWSMRREKGDTHSSANNPSTGTYVGAGHIPPVPPQGVTWGQNPSQQSAWIPPSWNIPPTPASQQGQPVPPATAAPSSVVQPPVTPVPQVSPEVTPRQGHSSNVTWALAMGASLLFFGALALLSNFVVGMEWWRFWPLIFMIAGIIYMVIPAVPGRRMKRFVNGAMLFLVGATFLTMSMGIVSWYSLELMMYSLWPLLLMMAGCFILSEALKSPLWRLAGGLCFLAFCVIGLWLFSIPGPTDVIILSSPFGWERSFVIR